MKKFRRQPLENPFSVSVFMPPPSCPSWLNTRIG